ncbi:MAG: redoxin domain-containing protein [Muribaculaceae bacterium]|nr:redoxin domain-containing protein [Muribaculaceae bacterium]
MKKIISLACAVAMLSSCNSNQWTVNGDVEGGAGKQIVVEASDNGWWYSIDTVEVSSTGKFSVNHEAAGYPDIYRLNMEGKMIYFPIDSIETVAVKSNVEKFDRDYVLSGSVSADKMMKVDGLVNEVILAKGEAAIVTDSLLKREISTLLLENPSDIVAYYIINKKVGKTALFDTRNKADLRVIGAVANAYAQMRPNDPRTAYLKNLYLSNRSVSTNVATNDTVYIDESPLIDIKLSDYKGEMHSLSELASQGKVIVLNFTMYGVEESTAFNMALAKIYEKRKAAGLEIFQVAAGGDEFQWKQAAKNLPWITVYNSPVTDAANLMNYNVTNLPTTFIINRKGEIVERVDDITTLDAKLNKYM